VWPGTKRSIGKFSVTASGGCNCPEYVCFDGRIEAKGLFMWYGTLHQCGPPTAQEDTGCHLCVLLYNEIQSSFSDG
jgi:hypothetical protein